MGYFTKGISMSNMDSHLERQEGKLSSPLRGGIISAVASYRRDFDKFSSLLNAQSGGDYYWTHQQDMQASCLSFQALPQNTAPVPFQLVKDNQVSPEHISTTADKVETNKTILETNVHFEIKARVSSMPPAKEILILKNKIERFLALNPQTKKSENNLKQKSEIAGKHLLREMPSYKNYHLFFDDSKAELSIQTQNLNKEQTRALKTRIREWLKKIGCSQVQLRINGVTA